MPSAARNLANLLGGSATIPQEKLGSDISTIEQVATTAQLSDIGNSVGDQRVVGNTLYIWNGTGWYRIALINETPTWDSGGQPSSTYILDTDSPQTATTITLAATDPDGLPINYSYVTGGSMDSIATVSQDSSIFTITPKTAAQAPDGGTGTITFRASDGVNILPYVSSFTLTFISIVENSNRTTLLATATGTSDNNNITDASTNNHSITVNGDAHAGTFSPYRSGGYSLSFNGIDESFEPNHSSASGLGTTWSFSFWANIPTSGVTNNSPYVVDFYRSGGGDDSFAMQVFTSTKKIELTTRVLGAQLSTATNLNCFDKWSYYVVTHSSGTTTLYIDGSSAGTSTDSAFSSIEAVSVQNLMLGARKSGSSSEFAKVDIRDFHLKSEIHNGTINNEAAVADSNTIILAAHKSYPAAQTGASTALAPVINNSVSTKPFSPYDYLEYSATDHGGSVYFDGTGDYLTISDSDDWYLDGDFTIETWFYKQNTSTFQHWFRQRIGSTSEFGVIMDFASNSFSSGDIAIEWHATQIQISADLTNEVWNHVVLQRSGTTLYWFTNGVLKYKATQPSALLNYAAPLYIGNYSVNNYLYKGYMSEFRWVKGSAAYSTSGNVGDQVFTPPTAPLSSSGTSLHIKGTDASIIDKSQGGNLKLEGNTTGSTTQVKFANTKSMYFDGTGDYITAGADAGNFGTGDFTIETWLRASSWNKGLFRKTTSTSSSSPPSISVYMASATILIGVNSGTVDGTWMSATNPFTLNTWGHFAITRVSGLVNVYADGSLIISTTRAVNVDNDITFRIGEWRNSTEYFTGYLQDFRITKGLARYTANFTPPTASLEG